VAWRVESPAGVFVYSGDSGVCDALVELAAGADLFLCEAAARVGDDARMRDRHLTPRQAGEAARLAGVRSLRLTHYDGRDAVPRMCADARASGYEGDLAVAADGDVLSVRGA
jgi:ribonuclease BN (tRNA processing enzyme)